MVHRGLEGYTRHSEAEQAVGSFYPGKTTGMTLGCSGISISALTMIGRPRRTRKVIPAAAADRVGPHPPAG